MIRRVFECAAGGMALAVCLHSRTDELGGPILATFATIGVFLHLAKALSRS